MENNIKNEGYNYYYGVTDNADLIQWMRDIDESVNKLVASNKRLWTNVDGLVDDRNKVAEYANELKDTINYNANVLNETREAFGLLAALLGIGTGVAILFSYVSLSVSDRNSRDIELIKSLAIQACEKVGINVDNVKEE